MVVSNAANENDELEKLADRHLAICESVYNSAIQRDDIDTAAHIAKSALSVTLNCTLNLRHKSKREVAFTWFGRLSDLYAKTTPAPNYLNRAIQWATEAMVNVFETAENGKPSNEAADGT